MSDKLLSVEEYLILDKTARLKLYLDKEFGINWDPQSTVKPPIIKYPCHFPDMAISSRCPLLERGVNCGDIREWINCEEVVLKRKLELRHANQDFEARKEQLLGNHEQQSSS